MPMPAGAGALAACKRLEVQVMWRFLTTATIFVILLAGSHASPALAAKAASPHLIKPSAAKLSLLPTATFAAKVAASMPMAAVGAATITAIPTIGP